MGDCVLSSSPSRALFLHLLFSSPGPIHVPWGPEQETLAPSQRELDQWPGILGLSPGLAARLMSLFSDSSFLL